MVFPRLISLVHGIPTARRRRRWAACIDELFVPRLGVSGRGRLRIPEPNLQAARESLTAIGAALREPHVAIDQSTLTSVITFVCDPTGVLYQGSPTAAHWEALRIERLVWLTERANAPSAEISAVQERSPQMTQFG